MRTTLRWLPATLLLLPACGDDAASGGTDAGSSSTTDPSTTGTPTTGTPVTGSSSSSGDAEESSSSSDAEGSSSSSGTGPDGSSSSSGSTTGSGAVTCDAAPIAPTSGSYEKGCAGAEVAQTCALSCENGTTPSGDAECGEDGEWSATTCDDPFDQDDDGVRRYPWGTDLDDDGDGEFTYLLGGDDYDDTNPAAQALLGDGTFTQGETYDLGASAGPTGVAVGDWDNDGNVDIATTNQNNDTLSFFVGAGDGTFTLSQTYVLTQESGGGRIKPGDFNGDGYLDIVATFSCRLYSGVGDGTFEDSGGGAGSCNYVHVVDTNDDEVLDVVSYTYGGAGQLRAFLGSKDGSFTTVDTPFPNINTLSPGFIDGDTTIDFGITEFGNWGVAAALGAGNGSYTTADYMDDASFYNAIAVPRDLTGDGNADFLVSDFINDHISVVAGDGAGQLSDTASMVIDGPAADGLFAADLDADGSSDIVYASQGAGFGVAMGTGGGSFGPPTQFDVGAGEFALEGADFNGDGRMDFVVINISSNDLTIMLGG